MKHKDWTPHQYVQDSNWPYEAILATAENGVAEEDAEELTEQQQAELVEWCKRRAEAEA